jgi:hypothetical protein
MKLMIGSRRSSQRAKPLLGVYWECPLIGTFSNGSMATKDAKNAERRAAYPILIFLSLTKA